MADEDSGLEFQSAVYRSYEALHAASTAFFAANAKQISLRDFGKGALAGEFIIADSLHGAAATLPVAALLAGACFLGLDSDAETAKQLLRAGQCDFVVNALDEALRILKNELRQKKPVAVCLTGNVPLILAEMLERGVSPEVMLHAEDADLSGPIPGERELARWSLPEGNPAMLARIDAILLAMLPTGDRPRRRWLESAPRFLPRQSPPARVCALTDAELELFVDAVAGRIMSGEISGPLRLSRGNRSLTLDGKDSAKKNDLR